MTGKRKERTLIRALGNGAMVFLFVAVFPAAANSGPYVGAFLFCIVAGLVCAAAWYWRLPAEGELRVEQLTNAVFAAFPLLLFGTAMVGNYFVWEGQHYMKINLQNPTFGTEFEARLILWQGMIVVSVSLLAMLLALKNRRELIEKEWKPLRKRKRWFLAVATALLLAIVLVVIIGSVRFRLWSRGMVRVFPEAFTPTEMQQE